MHKKLMGNEIRISCFNLGYERNYFGYFELDNVHKQKTGGKFYEVIFSKERT